MKDTKNEMNKISKTLLLLFAFTIIAHGDVQECYSELQDIYQHPQKHIHQFLASGKGFSEFGDAHLCHLRPETRYILVNLRFKNSLFLNGFLGICGPKHCSPDDFAQLSVVGKEFIANITNQSLDVFELTFYDPDIENAKLKDFSVGTWIMIFVLVTLFILGVAGSCIDAAESKSEKASQNIELSNHVAAIGNDDQGFPKQDALHQPQDNPHNPLILRVDTTPKWKAILKCFSFTSSLSKILSFERRETRTNVFNGIRVLSLTLIIFGHTTYYHARAPIVNVYELLTWSQGFWYQLMVASPFLVDNFLLIGGFLSIFGRADEAKKAGRVSVFGSYLHRIFRIMPLYLMMLFYFWKVQPIFSDGVAGFFYKKVMDMECNDTWWTNVLFINNKLPHGNVASCMGYTWYLAVDMQLFLVTPILFNIYLKKKLYGWLAAGGLTLASTAYAYYITYVQELTPIIIEQFFQTARYYEYYYVQPVPRFAPYGIGILMAFMYMEYLDGNTTAFTRFFVEKYKKRWFRYLSYVTAVMITLILIFVQYPLNNALFMVPQGFKSAYLAFGRLGWGIMLALFLLPVLFGHGESLYRFCSAKVWTPFTRLSFAAFLLHPAIMLWFYWNSNQGAFVQLLKNTEEFFGFWFLSMVTACIMSIMSESPGMNLEKLLTGRGRKEEALVSKA